MKPGIFSLIVRHKPCFIMGIICYFLMIAIVWLNYFSGHGGVLSFLCFKRQAYYPLTINLVDCAELGYYGDFLLIVPLFIGTLWWTLFLVVITKLLALMKPFFGGEYIFCHKKNAEPVRMSLVRGILVAAFGSTISMLFNPVFLVVMAIAESILGYGCLLDLLEANHYCALFIMYGASALVSGVLYGLLMVLFSRYKVARILNENCP
ncbi:MAG: hypothetical protein AB7F40_00075 [Victivallaceae bacterium]|nr:hypothetical protein [Victivallaceae bacterium]